MMNVDLSFLPIFRVVKVNNLRKIQMQPQRSGGQLSKDRSGLKEKCKDAAKKRMTRTLGLDQEVHKSEHGAQTSLDRLKAERHSKPKKFNRWLSLKAKMLPDLHIGVDGELFQTTLSSGKGAKAVSTTE